MLTRASRILVLVASLALALVYVLPIWEIDLEAPQYPEGIGMVIQIDNVEGQKPNDLNNINNLNHYIGMKRIVPESIPELKIMPWLVAVLLAGGLLSAALGRRRVLYAWVGLYVVVSVVGLADFYKWEYDYGHNLDEENAIIKVPGMNYQPPLIGSKQLLNFTAHSWPGAGGWILIGTALVGLGVAGTEWRRARRDSGTAPSTARAGTESSKGRAATAGLMLLVAAGTLACGSPEPRALEVGIDTCARCLMTVADDGSGTEAVTSTGLVYTFDSVECLAAWLDHDADGIDVHSVWVTDRAHPGDLLPAASAAFLASDGLPSPMGLGLSAWATAEDRDAALAEHGGAAMDWIAVQDYVRERWPDGRPAMMGAGGHGGHAESIRP